MPNPAAMRGVRKGLRTLLQTIAGGGLTLLVNVLAGGLDPGVQGLVMAAFTALVAYLQNYFETKGTIPAFLPTPGLITTKPADAVISVVTGTVDTVTDTVGTVTGAVLDTGGTVVGSVTSQVGGVVAAADDFVDGVVGTVTGGDEHDHAQAGIGGCCHSHGTADNE